MSGTAALIPEHLAKAFVARFGVAVPRGATAATPAEVAAAARGLRPPLVVKAYGPRLVHKSDAGAVRLGLASADEAARAAAEIEAVLRTGATGAGHGADGGTPGARAGAPGAPGARASGNGAPRGVRVTGADATPDEAATDARTGDANGARGPAGVGAGTDAARAADGAGPAHGYLVEEQAPAGVEMIVGVVRDPAFGHVLLAGLGGVWTEVLRDTALRLCPVTEDDARAMLAELRGAALLDGVRGAPPVDRDALVRVLLAVGGRGGVAETLGDALEEFELNPVICAPEGAVAVDARLLGPGEDELPPAASAGPPGATVRDAAAGGITDFTRLFEPRGVAVVGASATRPGFGTMFLGFYRAGGFGGRLVAVHPTATEIDGVPCVPSLADAGVDYALVAVPAERCPAVVREARGVPFVQVMSGGFRETGAAELEAELLAAARAAGVRLLGPNCMGVYSPKGGQTFVGGEPGAPGRIALVSQSGGMAGEVVRVGERRGLTFSKVATVGNSADVTPAELLRYLDADPETSVVGLYLEDPRDGRALFEALRSVRTPVVALVGGRSAQGHRAAASHTGAMIRDARVWDALARQTGLRTVESQEDLIGALDLLDLHAGRAVPPGPDVLVIGPSGGAGVLAADALDRAGLCLPPLPGVDLGLPVGAVPGNPLEIPVGPRGRPDLIRRVVSAVLDAHAYPDVLAHVNVQSFYTYGDGGGALAGYAGSVGELQADRPATRVTFVLRNAEYAPPGVEAELRRIARAAGVPVYRSVEAAARAIAAAKTPARPRTAGRATTRDGMREHPETGA